jgi:hypothetical protein
MFLDTMRAEKFKFNTSTLKQGLKKLKDSKTVVTLVLHCNPTL